MSDILLLVYVLTFAVHCAVIRNELALLSELKMGLKATSNVYNYGDCCLYLLEYVDVLFYHISHTRIFTCTHSFILTRMHTCTRAAAFDFNAN